MPPDELSSLHDELRDQLRPFGQEHLLANWARLSQLERLTLATDIAHVDLPLVARLVQQQQHDEGVRQLMARAAAPPAIRLAGGNPYTPAQARERGEAALRAGKIAAVMVAGGQGTRLGFSSPKGMYQIGPVSKASLFQILIERLVAVSRRYGVSIPLLLMTSAATHDETSEYLREQARFGLPAEDLVVFNQGTMPAVDKRTGRILMATHARLALSPDGHGGILTAMNEAKVFDLLAKRGIEHLFYFQVDNALAPVCGPEFLGYHLLSDSQASTLAVAKQTARDKVGNVVSIDGRLRIIEYTEFNQLDDSIVDRRQADGSLTFWAGNTAIHAFDVAFLREMSTGGGQLPFHIAVKKVPHVDEAGNEVHPDEPNALKFERFIFDLLPAARQAIVVEIDERAHFAPLKNAPGEPKDSPESVRAQMLALHTTWLKQVGATVKPGTPVEISPLFALDPEELRAKLKPGTVLDRATHLR